MIRQGGGAAAGPAASMVEQDQPEPGHPIDVPAPLPHRRAARPAGVQDDRKAGAHLGIGEIHAVARERPHAATVSTA
jgi:hypothetical protein